MKRRIFVFLIAALLVVPTTGFAMSHGDDHGNGPEHRDCHPTPHSFHRSGRSCSRASDEGSTLPPG